jgi:hypothetical protein
MGATFREMPDRCHAAMDAVPCGGGKAAVGGGGVVTPSQAAAARCGGGSRTVDGGVPGLALNTVTPPRADGNTGA